MKKWKAVAFFDKKPPVFRNWDLPLLRIRGNIMLYKHA
jgi:hypothetical protein